MKILKKTLNKVENYYRQTNPEKIKKLYKTKNGILRFLDYQMENWTEKTYKNQISL
jgi:HKD family nuclease